MGPTSQDPNVSQQEARANKESPRSCLREPTAWDLGYSLLTIQEGVLSCRAAAQGCQATVQEARQGPKRDRSSAQGTSTSIPEICMTLETDCRSSRKNTVTKLK